MAQLKKDHIRRDGIPILWQRRLGDSSPILAMEAKTLLLAMLSPHGPDPGKERQEIPGTLCKSVISAG